MTSETLFRICWAVFAALFYFLQSWLTVKNNLEGGKWFWVFVGVNLFPLWVLVSRFSKNVMFDAMLFDVILLTSYTLGLLYFTSTISKMSWVNTLGMIFFFLGLVLFKKGI